MRNLLHLAPRPRQSPIRHGAVIGVAVVGLLWAALTSGCQTASPGTTASGSESPTNRRAMAALTLKEGDVLKISFPGAANLDTVQPIRQDGRIALPIIGEIHASGFTPSELSAQLVKQYAPQLVYKEVTVTVVSSSFSVFVSGAVLRPGKIGSDHVLTALEAVMEAGGFDPTRANLRKVVIIRQGRALPNKLDLKRVFDGKEIEPFYLQPSDIVHVPDRMVFF